MSKIKDRIIQYIEYKGIGKREFCRSISVSPTFLANDSEISSDKVFNIFSEHPDISLEWLISGEGAMLRSKSPTNVTFQNSDVKGDKSGYQPQVYNVSPDAPKLMVADKVFSLRTDRMVGRQRIPIYDMEAVAGLVPLFAGSYSQQVVEVIETSLIPKCDGGLRIVGDSMYPLLKSGDVVFYKQIHDVVNNVIWGEMYLISFDIEGEEYVAVKYIKKSPNPDHIMLVSYNEHHSPLEIHIGRIRALAFIKASLRLNSIK